MRKRISYANVAATLALVFSMSGGALAATHYLINSTKQINPKVLKKLKGSTGKAGPAGPAGSAGAAGATGKEGPTGKQGKEGPEGEEGPAGPTAGGFVSSETLSPVLKTPGTSVMKLSEGSGAIVAPASGKLLVTAHGTFQKLNASALSDAVCVLELKANGGAFAPISKSAIIDLYKQFENTTLATTGGANVSAGSTYDVALTCESFNEETKFVRGDMTAVVSG
jgi:hypothetical protein